MLDLTASAHYRGRYPFEFIPTTVRVKQWKKILMSVEDLPTPTKLVGLRVATTSRDGCFGVHADLNRISADLGMDHEQVRHCLSALEQCHFLGQHWLSSSGSSLVFILTTPCGLSTEIYELDDSDWWPVLDEDLFEDVPREEPERQSTEVDAREARPSPPVKKHSIEQETHLYRHYDADGRLLYVGITKDLEHRTAAHGKASSWTDFVDVARSKFTKFPSRKKAKAAEKDAIRAELPLFNVSHNEHPNREKDLIEYLVSKGRSDLLALNVSRG